MPIIRSCTEPQPVSEKRESRTASRGEQRPLSLSILTGKVAHTLAIVPFAWRRVVRCRPQAECGRIFRCCTGS